MPPRIGQRLEKDFPQVFIEKTGNCAKSNNKDYKSDFGETVLFFLFKFKRS